MPAIYPTTDSFIVFTIHKTDPAANQGYVAFRWQRPGYSPDPMGSQPLLGKCPSEVIRSLRATFGHTDDSQMEVITD